LEVVDLKGSISFMRPELGHGPYTFAYLRPPSLDRRRVLRLHSSSFLLDSLLSFVKFVRNISVVMGMSLMQEGSMVLVVGSQEEKEQAEEAIQKGGGQWKSKFAVSLED